MTVLARHLKIPVNFKQLMPCNNQDMSDLELSCVSLILLLR